MHYELTDETITVDGRTLHRIRALKDLPEHGVKKGDLGGFIEHENNLTGDAWVGGNAWVSGEEAVSGMRGCSAKHRCAVAHGCSVKHGCMARHRCTEKHR